MIDPTPDCERHTYRGQQQLAKDKTSGGRQPRIERHIVESDAQLRCGATERQKSTLQMADPLLQCRRKIATIKLLPDCIGPPRHGDFGLDRRVGITEWPDVLGCGGEHGREVERCVGIIVVIEIQRHRVQSFRDFSREILDLRLFGRECVHHHRLADFHQHARSQPVLALIVDADRDDGHAAHADVTRGECNAGRAGFDRRQPRFVPAASFGKDQHHLSRRQRAVNCRKCIGVAQALRRPRSSRCSLVLRSSQWHHAHVAEERVRDRVFEQRCLAGERELSRRNQAGENRVHQFVRMIHHQQHRPGARNPVSAVEFHLAVVPPHCDACDCSEQPIAE